MTKMLITKNESKNWTITAYDINQEVVPITKANIIFIVKDKNNIKIEKKKLYQESKEDKEETDIVFVGDGSDGQLRIYIHPIDTANLEPGYYIYNLDISIRKKHFNTVSDEFVILPDDKKERDTKDEKEDMLDEKFKVGDEIDDRTFEEISKEMYKKWFLEV